ncbi:hypothetical protein HRbin26_02186 [bacterium HR26]|nr:hypothetical protein HRbin26_02186 [bacterium HR26]
MEGNRFLRDEGGVQHTQPAQLGEIQLDEGRARPLQGSQPGLPGVQRLRRAQRLAAAVVAQHADAQALHTATQRRLGIGNWNRARPAVPRVRPGQDLEEDRGVGHAPCDRPEVVERPGERDRAVEADPAEGRLEPDQATERGRDPDRAAGIGAERRDRHPVRDRRGRAAARPTGIVIEVPRVARRAIVGVVRGPGVGELR